MVSSSTSPLRLVTRLLFLRRNHLELVSILVNKLALRRPVAMIHFKAHRPWIMNSLWRSVVWRSKTTTLRSTAVNRGSPPSICNCQIPKLDHRHRCLSLELPTVLIPKLTTAATIPLLQDANLTRIIRTERMGLRTLPCTHPQVFPAAHPPYTVAWPLKTCYRTPSSTCIGNSRVFTMTTVPLVPAHSFIILLRNR